MLTRFRGQIGREEGRVAEDEEDEAFVEMPGVSSDNTRISP
jgi:hypothetical protein